MSILMTGCRGYVQTALTSFLTGPVALFKKINLLDNGELLSAAAVAAQAETAAVIRTPLAVVAVGARMFLISGFHYYIVRRSRRVAQAHGSSVAFCVAGKDNPTRKILQQEEEK